MHFEEKDLREGFNVLRAHPNVPYCYQSHETPNVWFYFVSSSKGSIRRRLSQLKEYAGAQKVFTFELLENFSYAFPNKNAWDQINSQTHAFSDTEVVLLRFLQDDLELTDHPFAKAASALEMKENELLHSIHDLKKRRLLIRIGATIARSGGRNEGNAVACWEVPAERQEEVGHVIAANPKVLRCTKRSSYEDFPYGLHALLRVKDLFDCEKVVRRIGRSIGSWPCMYFFKIKEHQNAQFRYFAGALRSPFQQSSEAVMASVKEDFR